MKLFIITAIGLASMATSTLFAQINPIAVAETHPDCYLLNTAPVSGGVAVSLVSVVALGIPGTDGYCESKMSSGGPLQLFVADLVAGKTSTIWVPVQWPSAASQFIPLAPGTYRLSTRSGFAWPTAMMAYWMIPTAEVYTSPVVVVGDAPPSAESQAAGWDLIPWAGTLLGGANPNGELRFQVATTAEPGAQALYGRFFQSDGEGGSNVVALSVAVFGNVGSVQLPVGFSFDWNVWVLLDDPRDLTSGAIYKVHDGRLGTTSVATPRASRRGRQAW